MGRSGPLDHPELLEVQAFLDQGDVAEAQRLLARLGNRSELAHGIAFLTTRLLQARGRLDHAGVAERLRDLVAAAPDFQEALALLSQAEALVATNGGPSPNVNGRSATLAVTSAMLESARPAPRTPQVPPDPPDAGPAAPMPGPSPASAAPPAATAKRPTSRPSSRRRGNGRRFTPITGFETSESHHPQPTPTPRGPAGSLPEIPRAPALPQFRDNYSPPSYAPDRRNTEPDLFKGKSLLPRNAGRYSETPTSMDIVEPNRPRRGKAPQAPSLPTAHHQPRETVPHTPQRIRSAAPPRASLSAPTLFEIASWIDEGRFRDAVAAINRAGPNVGPEYAVLRARALAGAGYVDQALDLVEQLVKDPSPDPELRAAMARLFVELGDPERALGIARGAFDAEPDRPLIRLTYALTAVRTSRRRRDPALLEHADRALHTFAAREGPLPALFLALRACILAGAGDPNRAISTAQRALGLDAKSPDAFAAIAEAAIQLGRGDDAREAWARLRELAPAEAEAMRAVLSAGLEPQRGESVAPREAPPLWSPLDVQLVAGRHADVLTSLERSAQEAIRRIAKNVLREDFTAVAAVAASFFTTAAVFSSFAPYDASLWSLRRLEAALELIFGRSSEATLPEQETGLVVLLGAYLGESLRLAHAGRWDGRSSDLDSAKVLAGDEELYPFRTVSARLHHGRRTAFSSSAQIGPARPGSEQWKTRFDNPVAPPTPWAPQAWPPPSQIGAIGRSLTQSPIGRFCQETAEGPLDRSTSSLVSLDAYLDLVAPRGAPVDADAAWTRRVSVLAGGYLGETLRDLVGGEWVYGVDAADDAHAYRLRLRGTTEALPVAHVLERVIGTRTSSLVDYARTLMRRAGRK